MCRVGKTESSGRCILRWILERHGCAFLFQLSYGKKVSFCGGLSATFFIFFLLFYWWFHCLKWHLSTEVKDSLLLLQARDCDVPYRENVYIQAWFIVLLAMMPMLVNQQYVLSKIPIHTNTHKAKLFIDQSI